MFTELSMNEALKMAARLDGAAKSRLGSPDIAAPSFG
jgi:hypothetical protein